jgi:thiosulfate/3-mercaptopyruvate sulfurtransferase
MKHAWMKAGLAVVGCLSVWAVQAGVLPSTVVSTQWLADNINKVQIVEVRSNPKSFTAQPEIETDAKTGKKTLVEVGGHITESRLIDMKTMRTERVIDGNTVKYMIPERAAFEATIQSAGLDAGKPVVLVPAGVDATDVDDALRVYWQLKIYGQDDMAVLDGGMAAWLMDGRAFSSAAPLSKRGTWVAKSDRSAQYFASSQDVAQAIASKSATLIDARDLKQYHGLTKRDYVYAFGHLEGAKLYSPDLMVKTADGVVRFLAPSTYRSLMVAQGIDPAAPTIAYCNSGHLSSGPWFVASEILGSRSAKLYDGSLHQWTLEKRPLVGAVPLN